MSDNILTANGISSDACMAELLAAMCESKDEAETTIACFNRLDRGATDIFNKLFGRQAQEATNAR
jgi:hypothetical protein